MNDYRYKKDRKCGSKHWRCVMVRQGCKARIHTVGDEENIDVIHQTSHDQLADGDSTCSVVTAARRGLVKERPTSSLKVVFRDPMTREDIPEDVMPLSFESCRNMMHRK